MERNRRFGVSVLVALAVAVLSAASATAQEGSITGRVTDAANNQSLRDAQVFVVGTARGVLTNNNGGYTLRIPPGTYTVRAQYIGYASSEQEVTIAAGGTQAINFQLEVGGLFLDAIVVTGARTQRSSVETTVPVDVLTAAAIAK